MGKLTGPKPPPKVRESWAIRIRLQLAGRLRDLALFNLAIDSKLRDSTTGTRSGPLARVMPSSHGNSTPSASR